MNNKTTKQKDMFQQTEILNDWQSLILLKLYNDIKKIYDATDNDTKIKISYDAVNKCALLYALMFSAYNKNSGYMEQSFKQNINTFFQQIQKSIQSEVSLSTIKKQLIDLMCELSYLQVTQNTQKRIEKLASDFLSYSIVLDK